MSVPFTRVVVCVHRDGTFHVVGYRRGQFIPQGRFGSVGEAVEFALTLPVRDKQHPINVLRGGLFG